MSVAVASPNQPARGDLPPVELPVFQGPLDLLLHLVRSGKMDIFDLPIVELCRQYLAYLRAMEELDLRIAGEFLVMAATLLEIKSRLLLPRPPKDAVEDSSEEGEDPRAELARRLLEYARYQGISDVLQDCEGERTRIFFREASPMLPEYRSPPRFGEMSADALLMALQRLLADVGAGERQITSVRRQKVTLRMTMRLLLGHAKQSGPAGVRLQDLFPPPPFERLDLILLFLALLELLRLGSIQVLQDVFCGEILVFATDSAEPDEPEADEQDSGDNHG